MVAHFAASMKLACEPTGKLSVRFSGGWIVLAISLTTAPSGRAAAAGMGAAPCPSLFASVLLYGFWWETYGIGNARAIYIGRFRNSGVSAVPLEPDAVNCVSSFLTSMRPRFLPFRPGKMLLVDGAASGFVLSKPCFCRFLSDALNAANGDNGGCCALALEFVPGGSANTYGLTEVSHGEQG